MKKLTIFTLLAFCIGFMNAQEMPTYTKEFDRVFKNISRKDATTGILYERVIPFAQLQNFDSKISTKVDTSSMEHFLRSYHELYNATFQTPKSFPFGSDSLNSIITNSQENTVDIGLLHYRFNTLDSVVAYQKLYYGGDSILCENNNITSSLYVEKNAFVASPLKEFVIVGTTQFQFRNFLRFDNTKNPIVKLKVDFDDGNGMQLISNTFKTVNYETTGKKVLQFEAQLKDGIKLTAFAILHCTSTPPKYVSNPSGHPYIEKLTGNKAIQAKITPPNPYDGGTFSKAKGDVWIYYAHSDMKLRKPVLIVDGFDPTNVRSFETHQNNGKTIWDMLFYKDANGTMQHIGNQLLWKDYDIVVLDLPEGGTYIERNAMVCIEVINRINQMLEDNGSEEEIVVIGPSMGGQITRYALTYMETNANANTNYGNHNCRLWVSFDSPHQGANISMGAQALLDYFSSENGNSAAAKIWRNLLCSKAAQQMLIHHKKTGAGNLYRGYYNGVRILNPSSKGHPDNLRKIAISNGSLNNTPNGVAHQIAFEAVFPAILYTLDIRVRHAVNVGRGEVFSATHWALFFPFHITWTFTNNTGKCSPDVAPGANYNTFDQLANAFKGIAPVKINKHTHNFMPVPSVLDINENMNYCTAISNRDLVAEGKTPFASYWGPLGKNMEHISFDQHLVNWVLNEIETYTVGTREIAICEQQDYSVHLPSGASNSTQVLWTCSDNLRIVSGQGTKTIQVKCTGNSDDTWVQATVASLTHTRDNSNIELANSKKQLKKFHITVLENTSPYLSVPTNITQNMLLDGTYEMLETVHINRNATLTVSGTIYAAPAAKIIVHPGGKLIVNGGRLTNSCDDEMWQGIEVHGNPNNPSQDALEQGFVELKNAAIVEGAHIGILVGSSNSSENYSGGILQAKDCQFINCSTGAEFKPYTRFKNTLELPNKSSFYNCEFIWNANLLAERKPSVSFTHVKLSGVGRVIFTACAFYNNDIRSNNTQGIYAHNSSVLVSGITSQNFTNYHPEVLQPTIFKGLTYGIYYEKSTSIVLIPATHVLQNMIKEYKRLPFSINRKLTVRYSDFIGNVQGVFNTNAHNSTICDNNFKLDNIASAPIVGVSVFTDEIISESMKKSGIEDMYEPIFNQAFGVGINLNASTGYTISRNTFTVINDDNPGIGIHVKNSGNAPNIIDNNYFDHLQFGILSNGRNRESIEDHGLQLLCNTFTKECQNGIVIASPSGIAQYQGSETTSAGNTFPQVRNADEWDIYTAPKIPIFYHYNPNVTGEEPTKKTNPYIVLSEVTQSRNCGFDFRWNASISEMVSLIKSTRIKYANLLYNYNKLIDGGSTDQLLAELELSWNKTAWEIRDDLLKQSPYLSSEVILEVAEKGILPHAMLLEICLENPDATRKEGLLYTLQYEIANPLPGYMCDLIIENWENMTIRTRLEAALAEVALELEYTSRHLINLYDDETNEKINYTDSIIHVLEHLPNVEAVYELADIYADRHQFDMAGKKLNDLFNRKFSENEREELAAMQVWHSFIENYAKRKDSVPTLSPEDIGLLQNLAETNTKAGDRAKSLFYYYSDCRYNYHVEPEFPDFIEPRSKENINPQDVLNKLYNEISVYPNPARAYATFAYEFQPEIQTSILQIYDAKGSLVLSAPLSGNVGHYLWDTRKVSSGTYSYTIISDSKRISNGKVVVKK